MMSAHAAAFGLWKDLEQQPLEREISGRYWSTHGISQGEAGDSVKLENSAESSRAREHVTNRRAGLSTGRGRVKPAFSTLSTDSRRKRSCFLGRVLSSAKTSERKIRPVTRTNGQEAR